VLRREYGAQKCPEHRPLVERVKFAHPEK
jgi:hypothetical protein